MCVPWRMFLTLKSITLQPCVPHHPNRQPPLLSRSDCRGRWEAEGPFCQHKPLSLGWHKRPAKESPVGSFRPQFLLLLAVSPQRDVKAAAHRGWCNLSSSLIEFCRGHGRGTTIWTRQIAFLPKQDWMEGKRGKRGVKHG